LTIRKPNERRIMVAEMNWLRKKLGRSRKQKIKTEEIRIRTKLEVRLVDRIKTPMIWTCIKNGKYNSSVHSLPRSTYKSGRTACRKSHVLV